ncbi:hypothetical protein C4573_06730 [Candidatus Woesearchaeota archaeon]|nr:MAG: hypothetical protein C4573_06730 [Candidatus Woesearchaeota archaeon]
MDVETHTAINTGQYYRSGIRGELSDELTFPFLKTNPWKRGRTLDFIETGPGMDPTYSVGRQCQIHFPQEYTLTKHKHRKPRFRFGTVKSITEYVSNTDANEKVYMIEIDLGIATVYVNSEFLSTHHVNKRK